MKFDVRVLAPDETPMPIRGAGLIIVTGTRRYRYDVKTNEYIIVNVEDQIKNTLEEQRLLEGVHWTFKKVSVNKTNLSCTINIADPEVLILAKLILG